jgi:hypothetical protein
LLRATDDIKYQKTLEDNLYGCPGKDNTIKFIESCPYKFFEGKCIDDGGGNSDYCSDHAFSLKLSGTA